MSTYDNPHTGIYPFDDKLKDGFRKNNNFKPVIDIYMVK